MSERIDPLVALKIDEAHEMDGRAALRRALGVVDPATRAALAPAQRSQALDDATTDAAALQREGSEHHGAPGPEVDRIERGGVISASPGDARADVDVEGDR